MKYNCYAIKASCVCDGDQLLPRGSTSKHRQDKVSEKIPQLNTPWLLQVTVHSLIVPAKQITYLLSLFTCIHWHWLKREWCRRVLVSFSRTLAISAAQKKRLKHFYSVGRFNQEIDDLLTGRYPFSLKTGWRWFIRDSFTTWLSYNHPVLVITKHNTIQSGRSSSR